MQDILIGDRASVSVVYGSETLPAEVDLTDDGGAAGFSLGVRGDHVDATDFNGDGIDDLLVSVEDSTRGYVFFGSKNSLPSATSHQDLDGSNGFAVQSRIPNQLLLSIGDVNADGVEDIALAPGLSGRTDAPIQVVFGSRDEFPPVLDTNGLTPSQGFVVEGFLDRFRPDFPRSVAGSGDVNGDGIDDLVVGDPNFNPGVTHGNPVGAIYVLFGGPSITSDISEITPTTGFGFVGHGAFEWGDQLGFDVSRLGDFNGDGLNDLFIRPQGINDDHRAIVLYGKPSPLSGDADSDGFVGFGDFLILANNFGKEDDVFFHDGDFDGDGRVSFLDFLVLAQNFQANE